MKAIHVERLDSMQAVVFREAADPVPIGAQVLIEVRAVGVTFPDLLQSRGLYQDKAELPFILGMQVAGVVRHAPSGSLVQASDRVSALTASGGYAELATAEPSHVFALPESISFEAGAVLPINYLTAHFAYTSRARLQAGETVLVHGAGGGLGTAAVQYAAALGARVIAVVSSPEKEAAAARAGAHDVVAVEGFLDSTKALTDGAGVDLVFDPVGGDRFTDSLRTLRPEGRLLVLGFTGGAIPTVQVNRLLLGNIGVLGALWGAHIAAHPEYLREQWNDLRPLLESGALDPVIGASYPLSAAADALSALYDRSAVGNLVLTVGT